MTELLRKIAVRLRDYVGNRRWAPRRSVRLPVLVALLDERAVAQPTLAGHTRDLSESGLGLVLPAVRLGDRYLTGGGQTLRVTLQLPGTHVRLYATPVRYERLEGEGEERGYLLGLSLSETEDADRQKFLDYLRSVGK
ncbi:MAG TPA: PilZ domain-containing protein [Pyrinomonadaceae bacterium]|nr:PilZ domain-containing protein [Pyrinomonadaceae bacterium]